MRSYGLLGLGGFGGGVRLLLETLPVGAALAAMHCALRQTLEFVQRLRPNRGQPLFHTARRISHIHVGRQGRSYEELFASGPDGYQ